MAEETQYCIYPLHITKKEKKICCCIQTEEWTDFPLLKICVLCGRAIIETSLIIRMEGSRVEKELEVHASAPQTLPTVADGKLCQYVSRLLRDKDQ